MDGERFRGFSPESYAGVLRAGDEYFRELGRHTCTWAVAAAQPLTTDPDIVVPALTLGIQRHFPLQPGHQYNPPQRIENLSHVIDFVEREAPRLTPDKSSYTDALLDKTGWLLQLMSRTGEAMGYPIVNAWGVRLDTSEPFMRIDALAPNGANLEDLLRKAAETHDVALQGDCLAFEYGPPGFLDFYIERISGRPTQNPQQPYIVHYGFDPLRGAALRADHDL